MFAILPAGTGKTILLIQRYANRLRTLFYVLGNIFTILLKTRHRTENETNLWRSGLTPVALGNSIVNEDLILLVGAQAARARAGGLLHGTSSPNQTFPNLTIDKKSLGWMWTVAPVRRSRGGKYDGGRETIGR